jgi:transglutaminase/protease-like cytokinesis protein 3
MPSTAETSVRAVGAYIRDHTLDSRDRARAVHDWIADQIAYDSGTVPPIGDSRVEWVFLHRRGDCTGFAGLFVELGRAAGLDVRLIVGLALDRGILGIHAWNEVRIGGRYEPIDVTWDAGYVDEAFVFHKRYSTEYFLPSREVFRRDHTTAEYGGALWPEAHSEGRLLPRVEERR